MSAESERGRLRITWVSFHMEGLPALEAVIESGEAEVNAVITLTLERAARRSGAVDYGPVCRRNGITMHRITNINDEDAIRLLGDLEPDLLVVLGWGQILRREALSIPRIGVVGAHASPLPHNRGSAPVNWTIIRGETGGGNTLMWLSEEVDAGRIIDQVTFEITPFDTCATVYEKVAQSNRTMILGLLGALREGRRPGTEQGRTDEALLPRRKPSDGLVNWEGTAEGVYDFVRALTRPYPGAFSFMDGRRWRIWSAALLPGDDPRGQAGEIVGPLLSPEDRACGLIVSCGRGAIALLEIETDDDERLSGRALAELQWTGRRWAENGPSAGNRSASGR